MVQHVLIMLLELELQELLKIAGFMPQQQNVVNVIEVSVFGPKLQEEPLFVKNYIGGSPTIGLLHGSINHNWVIQMLELILPVKLVILLLQEDVLCH